MRISVLPKTRLGKWSVHASVAGLFVFAVWQFGLGWERHRQAVWERLNPVPYVHPPLPSVFNWNLVSYVTIILCLATTGLGIIASAKERSVVVLLITVIGLLILLLMIGNLFFPHQTPF